MKLEAILRSHSYMRVERPPLLWEADTQDEAFIRLLGEMIAFVLQRSSSVYGLTLSAANVVVEPDASSHQISAGEYVAVTVSGPGRDTPEFRWWPTASRTFEEFGDLTRAASAAGGVWLYTRNLGDKGSITTLLRRTVDAA